MARSRARRWIVVGISTVVLAATTAAVEPASAQETQPPPPNADQREVTDPSALQVRVRVPSRAQVTAAGDTAAERLCAAEPTLFGSRSDDAAVAADLMAGKLTIAPFQTVQLPADPDWSEVLVKQSNWEVKYQALTWLDPLRREHLRTGDVAMLDRYRFYIQDFLTDNPAHPNGRSRWTWYDAPTGHRSSVLACSTTALGQPDWLLKGMRSHVVALKDPAYYKGWGNHSLMQNSGLYSLGCVLPDTTARDVATTRSDALLVKAVDLQGVIDEGSLGYQISNYQWWSEMRLKLHACGDVPSPEFVRIDRMPQVIADATQPTGQLTPFGDTLLDATGRTTPSPSGLTAFYDRGYLFSRSSMDPIGTSNPGSMLSLRYGQSYHSQAHGHMDAGNLEFFGYGDPLVSDSGMHAYGGGYWRSYIKSPAAHNMMWADGAEYRRDRTTPLKYRKVTSDFTMTSVATTVISGANWKRTVVHSRRGGWVLIDDQVQQTSTRTLTQRLNLPLGSSFAVTAGKRVDETGSGANLSVLYLGGSPYTAIRRAWQTPDKPYTTGWRSLAYGAVSGSSTLEARKSASNWHVVTLLVARPEGQGPASVSARDVSVTSTGVAVTVDSPTTQERVAVRPDYFAGRVLAVK